MKAIPMDVFKNFVVKMQSAYQQNQDMNVYVLKDRLETLTGDVILKYRYYCQYFVRCYRNKFIVVM